MLLHSLPHDDWFDDEPLDLAPSSYEPDIEVSTTPEGGCSTRKDQLKDVTMHEKMYQIATANYNPFAVGGSESLGSIGGSENVQDK